MFSRPVQPFQENSCVWSSVFFLNSLLAPQPSGYFMAIASRRTGQARSLTRLRSCTSASSNCSNQGREAPHASCSQRTTTALLTAAHVRDKRPQHAPLLLRPEHACCSESSCCEVPLHASRPLLRHCYPATVNGPARAVRAWLALGGPNMHFPVLIVPPEAVASRQPLVRRVPFSPWEAWARSSLPFAFHGVGGAQKNPAAGTLAAG